MREVRQLRNTIERYANGGFEMIERVIADDPDAVYSDEFFVKLLIV